MLKALGVSGPRRHVLEIGGAAVARKVFWIMLNVAGGEFLFDRLRQQRSQCPAGRHVCDAQEKAIISEDIEGVVILCVISDVHVHSAVFGVCWKGRKSTRLNS